MRDRLPVPLLRMSVLVSLADEALAFFPIDFEDNNPLGARLASLAKIPFIIAVSFLLRALQLRLSCIEVNGFEGKVSTFPQGVTSTVRC
jgi:hypothetical protein